MKLFWTAKPGGPAVPDGMFLIKVEYDNHHYQQIAHCEMFQSESEYFEQTIETMERMLSQLIEMNK